MWCRCFCITFNLLECLQDKCKQFADKQAILQARLVEKDAEIQSLKAQLHDQITLKEQLRRTETKLDIQVPILGCQNSFVATSTHWRRWNIKRFRLTLKKFLSIHVSRKNRTGWDYIPNKITNLHKDLRFLSFSITFSISINESVLLHIWKSSLQILENKSKADQIRVLTEQAEVVKKQHASEVQQKEEVSQICRSFQFLKI